VRGSTRVPEIGDRALVSFYIIIANDNMDRASQVLAQGVPPDVPKSYRALALLEFYRDYYNHTASDHDTWSLDWRRYQPKWRRPMTWHALAATIVAIAF